jgi:hypothetical protein
MLSIYTLEKGVVYTVTKSFRDYQNNAFSEGERLTFVGQEFLPYHGGHTIMFKERNLYLQEDINRDFIDSFHEYLTV